MQHLKEAVLQLESRKRIFDIIQEQPGICIRELQRTAGMAIGELTYHLPILIKAKLIEEETDAYFRRFFPTNLNKQERKTLSLLRREAVRKVIPLLLEKKRITNKEIANSLKVSASTVSWHIKRLKENNLITLEKRGSTIFYSLIDRDAIKYIYKI